MYPNLFSMDKKRAREEKEEDNNDMKATKEYSGNKNNVFPGGEVLVQEIFLRLPFKSLVRLTTGCKQLYNLNNDQYFANQYRSRRTPNPSALILPAFPFSPGKYYFHVYDIGDDSFTFRKSVNLHKSWNRTLSSYGLLCLQGYGDGKGIVVVNPTTGEMANLPDSPHSQSVQDLGYHPQIKEYRIRVLTFGENLEGPVRPHSQSIMGFGYHPPTNRYKIVDLVTNANFFGVLGCYVLTLEPGRASQSVWKSVDTNDVEFLKCNCNCNCKCYGDPKVVTKGDRFAFMGDVVCVEGVLFWEVAPIKPPRCLPRIILFDLGNEKMKMISVPPSSFNTYAHHLVELKGRVCLSASVLDNKRKSAMVISMLNLCLDSHTYYWTEIHRLDFGLPQEATIFPLCIIENSNGDIILIQEGNFLWYTVLGEKNSSNKSLGLKEYDQRITEGMPFLPPQSGVLHAETLVHLN